jgi:hypothetical protein
MMPVTTTLMIMVLMFARMQATGEDPEAGQTANEAKVRCRQNDWSSRVWSDDML